MEDVNDRARYAQLRAFLKDRRRRIVPTSRSLGSHQRLPSRLGRRVTQEELAEAIGVSRTWYVQLECGSAVRASTRLLDRLAFALMLTPYERTALFSLAVPELRNLHTGSTDEQRDDLDAAY